MTDMADRTYRVAIIGTGGIARSHARSWAATGRVDIVAAVDIRDEAVQAFGDEYDIAARYTSHEEMLSAEKPEIVSICTWHGTHPSMTIAAAEAGADGIMCEKPMAINLADADAMLAACEASGTKLAIGHHHRFAPRNSEARRQISAGAIGVPHMLRMTVGGGLTNNGTHAIDGARYLLGDPVAEWVIGQVERRTDRYERKEPIEDLCMGLVAFEGGARLVLESDMPDGGLNGSAARLGGLQVYGTEGTISVGDGVTVTSASGAVDADVPADTNQYDELLAWLDGGSVHRNEGSNARATVEVMMAIYESARSRGLVNLPLDAGPSPLVSMIDDGSLPVEKPGRYDIRL